MDIASIVGILLFIMGMAIGVGEGFSVPSTDELRIFYQTSGVAIVFIGSSGACLLRCQLSEYFLLFPTIFKIFRHKVDKPTDLIDQMVELATIARKDGMIALESQEISNRMLGKGVRALVDGNDARFIRSSLQKDTAITANRHESARGVLQSMGDIAPAMGMIGTLIGLVKLLKNLEEDPGGIGVAMSTALLTTLYGAILANGFCLPMVQKLENYAKREEANNEMIIEGVIFIQGGGNPRLLEDLLSAYLSPKVNKKRQAASAG